MKRVISVGSLVAAMLVATPAQAGKLTFWRFNENDNRLIFQTEDRVQPKAQLIFNPTRVVIDLPQTVFGHSLVNQPVGGVVRAVRVGQFNQETTRLVVELAPGYTVDPQQVKIREESPQRWSVELPPAQRVSNETARRSEIEPKASPSQERTTVNSNPPLLEGAIIDNPYFQVTRSGLLLRLNGSLGKDIQVERSEDGKKISFRLPRVTLPSDLPPVLPVEDYGISYAQFQAGPNNSAEVTLHVNEDSPNWQAFPTVARRGGVVFLPEGGMGAVRGNLSSPPLPRWVAEKVEQSQRTVVQAVDLVENQLMIRANGTISGQGSWNRVSGVYELRIPNAQLAEPVRGPRLTRNSPVSQIRVRQEDEETVVVQVQSAPGVKILDQVNQPSQNTLAIALRQVRQTRAANLPPLVNQRQSIPVPRPSSPPPSPAPSPNRNNDGLLVVIDPGHGGKDPGAVGIGGLQEKHVVLPISHHVRQTLESQGLQVKMTRWDDRFISLAGRTEMANRLNADLFISIHANAISMSRPDVNGVETFYYSNGRALAQAIQNSILANINMRNRGVKQANFYVLRNSAMPSVLVEVGFVTGREDAPRLANPNFRKRMADAIAEGILQYVRQTQ